jgi:site-specific DNA-cytosine methylase
MTPRCLTRFQSFPDDYKLPAGFSIRNFALADVMGLNISDKWVSEWINTNGGLACRVIGNAVPPLLYQRVIEAQLS